MVIGQGWIALKPEYCIRERQLVRSQNRLSYERGWVRRGGGGRRRAVATGMESRGREWGAQEEREGEVIVRNSSPGRCGVEGIIRNPFRHYLPFLTCQKERARKRGACRSSERSEEDAEAPLIFPVRRAHRCSQTSGLTLITHIYRQGGGEERSASIFEPLKNYRPSLIHFLYFYFLFF